MIIYHSHAGNGITMQRYVYLNMQIQTLSLFASLITHAKLCIRLYIHL